MDNHKCPTDCNHVVILRQKADDELCKFLLPLLEVVAARYGELKDDFIQETIYEILNQSIVKKFAYKAPFCHFIKKVAAREMAKKIKVYNRINDYEVHGFDEKIIAGSKFDQDENLYQIDRTELSKALEKLKVKDRQIWMDTVDQVPRKVTAQKLNVSEATIYYRFKKIRKHLSRFIQTTKGPE